MKSIYVIWADYDGEYVKKFPYGNGKGGAQLAAKDFIKSLRRKERSKSRHYETRIVAVVIGILWTGENTIRVK